MKYQRNRKGPLFFQYLILFTKNHYVNVDLRNDKKFILSYIDYRLEIIIITISYHMLYIILRRSAIARRKKNECRNYDIVEKCFVIILILLQDKIHS